MSQWQKKMKTLQGAITGLQNLYEAAEGKASDSQAALLEQKKQVAMLERVLEEGGRLKEEQETTIGTLMKEMQSALADNKRLEKELKAAVAEVAKLDAKHRRQSEKLEKSLVQGREESKDLLRTAEEKSQRLEDELMGLRYRINQREELFAQGAEEAAELRSQLKERDTRLQEASEQLEELRRQNQELMDELTQARKSKASSTSAAMKPSAGEGLEEPVESFPPPRKPRKRRRTKPRTSK